MSSENAHARMYLILGCTASGKGKLAFEIARRLGGEILSVDSMKVYRRMDIGTAKPDRLRRRLIPHHLIDVVEPWESFSLGKFIEHAEKAIADIRRRQRPIIAVGGTAMYLRGLLEGIFDGPPADPQLRAQLREQAAQHGWAHLHNRLRAVDPTAAANIHPNDAKRITRALEVYEQTGQPISSLQRQFRSGRYKYPWTMIGLRRDKQDGNHRINQRVKFMIQSGLVDEVRRLLDDPRGLSPQASQAVGYAEIIAHLNGEYSLEKAVELIKINTRRFAKRQRTWFRGFTGVHWFDLTPDEEVNNLADRVMHRLGIE